MKLQKLFLHKSHLQSHLQEEQWMGKCIKLPNHLPFRKSFQSTRLKLYLPHYLTNCKYIRRPIDVKLNKFKLGNKNFACRSSIPNSTSKTNKFNHGHSITVVLYIEFKIVFLSQCISLGSFVLPQYYLHQISISQHHRTHKHEDN